MSRLLYVERKPRVDTALLFFVVVSIGIINLIFGIIIDTFSSADSANTVATEALLLFK